MVWSWLLTASIVGLIVCFDPRRVPLLGEQMNAEQPPIGRNTGFSWEASRRFEMTVRLLVEIVIVVIVIYVAFRFFRKRG